MCASTLRVFWHKSTTSAHSCGIVLCMTLDMSAPPHNRIPIIQLRHRLLIALQDSGVDKQVIADELGISINTVHNYLAGRTHPRRSVVVLWGFVTGVDPRWLLTGEIPGHDPGGGASTSGYSRGFEAVDCGILRLVA